MASRDQEYFYYTLDENGNRVPDFSVPHPNARIREIYRRGLASLPFPLDQLARLFRRKS